MLRKLNKHLLIVLILASCICIYVGHFYGGRLFQEQIIQSNHRRFNRSDGSLYIIRNKDKHVDDTKITSVHGIIQDDTKITNVHVIQDATVDRYISSSMLKAVTDAIDNGASWLFLAPDHQSQTVNPAVNKFNLQLETTSLLYTGPVRNNVNFHFIAQPFNRSSDFKRSYQMAKYDTPLIQTFFQSDNVNLMDYRAAPVAVPVSSLYPFTLHNTLYGYDAFWALVPLRVDTFIWSMWTGRLLKEINEMIIFHAPPPSDVQGIVAPPKENLRHLLSQWTCDARLTFFKCMVDLTHFLKDHQILSDDDVTMSVRWVQELSSSGYREPTRRTRIPKVNVLHQMLFWPSRGATTTEKYKYVFKGKCSKYPASCQIKSRHKSIWGNILLVIVINNPGYYHVIDYIESLYRPHFPQILYCAHNMANLNKIHPNLKYKQFSFIDVNFNHGQYGYQCLQKAHQLHYDVDGYIHLSDDVMLNLWNFASLPLDKVWFQHSMRVGNLTDKQVPDIAEDPYFGQWTSSMGVNQTIQTFRELENVSKSNSSMSGKVSMFLETLAKNAGGENRVFYEAADIYYLPVKLATDYAYFVNFFNRNGVHFEIAIPTMLNGLSTDIVKLPGSYLWHKERLNYKQYYNTEHIFLHPIKLGPCLNDPSCYSFYCTKYVSCWQNL